MALREEGNGRGRQVCAEGRCSFARRRPATPPSRAFRPSSRAYAYHQDAHRARAPRELGALAMAAAEALRAQRPGLRVVGASRLAAAAGHIDLVATCVRTGRVELVSLSRPPPGQGWASMLALWDGQEWSFVPPSVDILHPPPQAS
jgi:hypothetical protein